jgi:hypothetical protein
MTQMDALQLVDLMQRRVVDLAVSENYLRDEGLSKGAAEIWRGPGRDGGLVSELWVQGAFPSQSSEDSLASLASEGLFPKDLAAYSESPGRKSIDFVARWRRLPASTRFLLCETGCVNSRERARSIAQSRFGSAR